MVKSPLFARKQSGGMFAVVDERITTGNIFWVDSGNTTQGADAAGYGLNPDIPFLTIDYAVGQCTASNGDIIYVMPGHAETFSTANDLLVDVAGVSIIGIGESASKPTISVDTEHTEEAGLAITAAGCTIKNIRFVGINAGGSKNTIAISASDTTIDSCEFIETSTDKELGIGAAYGIITILDADGAVARIKILNCICNGLAGNDESFISVTDGSLGASWCTIDGCTIIGTFADDIIQADAGTNVNTYWTVTNSILANLGGDNLCATIDTGAVFFLENLALFGAGATTAPLVGYNISYMGRVYSCEPGAFGATGLIGSTTNWSA